MKKSFLIGMMVGTVGTSILMQKTKVCTMLNKLKK